jgi:hypothetical protein
MQVKVQTTDLKNHLNDLNMRTQLSGSKLVEKVCHKMSLFFLHFFLSFPSPYFFQYRRLIELRKTKFNIVQAKETVTDLQYLLQLIVKTNQAVANKEYVFALEVIATNSFFSLSVSLHFFPILQFLFPFCYSV